MAKSLRNGCRSVLARLKAFFLATDVKGGLGQSLAEDAAYLARFRQCRRTRVAWRKPSAAEAAQWECHPVVDRFGDLTVTVAEVDGRRWVVRERIWSGWPDPPTYVWFAIEGEAVWAAADFERWPPAWTPPPGYKV